jgi:hypothetical protein
LTSKSGFLNASLSGFGIDRPIFLASASLILSCLVYFRATIAISIGSLGSALSGSTF